MSTPNEPIQALRKIVVPMHWQDNTQMKRALRGKVRRLLKDLDLDGWQKVISMAVEHYAVLHYRRP